MSNRRCDRAREARHCNLSPRRRPSARPCTMVPSMCRDGAWLSSEDWGDDPEADPTAPGP